MNGPAHDSHDGNPDKGLRTLADEAGIQTRWMDNEGAQREIGVETLRHALSAMGMDCSVAADSASHLARLQQESQTACPPLITADAGADIALPQAFLVHMLRGHQRAVITLESGRRVDRVLERNSSDGVYISAINDAGYHRLESGNRSIILAVAPPRCWSVADIAGDEKMWGAAAQIHALRHRAEMATYACGTGDFATVRECASALAAHGADALALSPSHALFSGDAGHFSPYSPSNRCFLNVLHGAPGDVFDETRMARGPQCALARSSRAGKKSTDRVAAECNGAARISACAVRRFSYT